MSDQQANQALGLSVPRGEAIGTFETYPEAQSLVNRLAESGGFDVAKVSIVGNDLKTVERVTGRLSWGKAALSGAMNGLGVGFFVVLVISMFTGDIESGWRSYAATVLITTGLGLVFSLVSYAITRRRHDFTSTQQVLASNYQVIVPAELAEAARQAAAQQPAA